MPGKTNNKTVNKKKALGRGLNSLFEDNKINIEKAE